LHGEDGRTGVQVCWYFHCTLLCHLIFSFFMYWMPLLYDCLFLFWWFVYIIAPDKWDTWLFYPAPTWLASYRVDEIWLMFNLTISIGQSDQPHDITYFGVFCLFFLLIIDKLSCRVLIINTCILCMSNRFMYKYIKGCMFKKNVYTKFVWKFV
jgi:hypothetical protein